MEAEIKLEFQFFWDVMTCHTASILQIQAAIGNWLTLKMNTLTPFETSGIIYPLSHPRTLDSALRPLWGPPSSHKVIFTVAIFATPTGFSLVRSLLTEAHRSAEDSQILRITHSPLLDKIKCVSLSRSVPTAILPYDDILLSRRTWCNFD